METFSNIPAHTRSQDVKVQKMQKFLLKSAYPIVKLLDSILASSNSNNLETQITCSDSLPVLSQSNQELLQQRQDGIIKNLSRGYKTLKHNVPPDSKLLFSGNINSRIKLCKPITKLARLISHQIPVNITKFAVPI